MYFNRKLVHIFKISFLFIIVAFLIERFIPSFGKSILQLYAPQGMMDHYVREFIEMGTYNSVGRVFGLAQDPNIGGIVASLGILIFYSWLKIEERWRFSTSIFLVGLVASLLMSGSLSSFISLIIAVMFSLVLNGSTKKEVFSLIFIALAIMLIIMNNSTNQSIISSRLAGVWGVFQILMNLGSDESYYTRIAYQNEFWQQFGDYIIFGVGEFRDKSGLLLINLNPHNWYITSIMRYGLLGMLTHLLLILYPATKVTLFYFRTGNKYAQSIQINIYILFTVLILVTSIAHPNFYDQQVNSILAVLNGSAIAIYYMYKHTIQNEFHT